MKTDAGQDVLRILDHGIVVAGDVQVKPLGLKVLPVKVNLLISSVERAEDLGLSWWEGKKKGRGAASAPPARAGGSRSPRNGMRRRA